MERPAAARVGKRVRGSLYVHRNATAHLAPEAAHLLARAMRAAPSASWNVARLNATTACLLEYEDFEVVAFPGLLESTLVDVVSGRVSSRDHRGAGNPLILHRKELLVHPDRPRRAEWAALTADLIARKLFCDGTRIGRRRHWNSLLAAAGLDPDGRAS